MKRFAAGLVFILAGILLCGINWLGAAAVSSLTEWEGTRMDGAWKLVGRGRAIAILVVLSLLALFGSACGDNASDPFLGTWEEQGSSSPWVVGKLGADYQVTMALGTWGHAERDGEALHLWAGARPQLGKEMYLTYQPNSGELLLTDPAGPGVHVLLHKVGDSTAVPSPFPGGAGDAFSTP